MGLEHRERGPPLGRVDVGEQQPATAGPGHIGDHPVAAQRGREREPSQPQLEVDADAEEPGADELAPARSVGELIADRVHHPAAAGIERELADGPAGEIQQHPGLAHHDVLGDHVARVVVAQRA